MTRSTRADGDTGQSLTSQQIARLRVRALKLDEPAASIEQAVGDTLALQGQDFRASLWAVGIRVAGCTERDVIEAINHRVLGRGWPLRNTVHLTLASDLQWLTALALGRALQGVERRRQIVGIDEQTLERARSIAEGALSGGTVLTRAEFLALLTNSGIEVRSGSGYHIIWYLSVTGTLTFASVLGREPGLALAAEWLPQQTPRQKSAALADLATRYFSSHGPATEADLARWANLPLVDVRAGIAAAGDALAHVDHEGVGYLLAPDAIAHVDKPLASRVLALPGFDEFVIGYKTKEHSLHPDHLQKIVPGNNGVFKPVIVVDGEVVGTWAARDRKKKGLSFDVEEFRPHAADRTAIESALADYATFRGLPIESVTVR